MFDNTGEQVNSIKSKKDQIVKQLKMMGYEIAEFDMYIRVMLRNRRGTVVTYALSYESLFREYIVEEIVRALNASIINNF
jgi:hypothetical protein